MAVTIYHNPRCSKSRQALQSLRDRGIEPEIVDYLKTPPSADEIDAVLSKLRLEPRAAMRAKEAAYREAGMADESLSRRALIDLMAAQSHRDRAADRGQRRPRGSSPAFSPRSWSARRSPADRAGTARSAMRCIGQAV